MRDFIIGRRRKLVEVTSQCVEFLKSSVDSAIGKVKEGIGAAGLGPIR